MIARVIFLYLLSFFYEVLIKTGLILIQQMSALHKIYITVASVPVIIYMLQEKEPILRYNS